MRRAILQNSVIEVNLQPTAPFAGWLTAFTH